MPIALEQIAKAIEDGRELDFEKIARDLEIPGAETMTDAQLTHAILKALAEFDPDKKIYVYGAIVKMN